MMIERVRELYRRMVLLRAVEMAIEWPRVAPAQGQEAVTVGVATALAAEDCVVTSERPYRFALARGMDAETVMREALADGTGRPQRRGRPDWRIITGGFCAALELAPVLSHRRARPAVLCAPADWGVSPGMVGRTLHIAMRRRLPLVLLIRDAADRTSMPAPSACRGAPLQIRRERVIGDQVGAIHEATAHLLAYAREDRQPALLEVAKPWGGAQGTPPDPLSITASELVELGAEPGQLLQIAESAEAIVREAPGVRLPRRHPPWIAGTANCY